MAERSFDAIVAGAGLVGAAAALALGAGGASVLLLDRKAPERSRGQLGFDLRTVALNPASSALLRRLGVDVEALGEPFSHMYVWEEHGTRHIEFHAADVGRATLGHIVEVSAATVALWAALDRAPRVTRETGREVTAAVAVAGGVRLRWGDEPIAARLLVAADGGHSTIRDLLGERAERFETGQAAIVSVVETTNAHGGTAWQRFLHEGPIALLPLRARDGRNFCSLVWSQPVAHAAARMQLDDATFAAEVARATESKLGAILLVDRRVSFPLTQQLADRFAPVSGVLLVGDAARVLHPLAGQGVNLGFEDVAELGAVLERAGKEALADRGLWQGWARRRRVRAEIMVRAMDAFRRVYAVNDPTVQWLRNVGVDFVNRTPLIKTQLMKEALGLHA
jgi:ubiquinone biosynthesis UbiH/UbiF/VisC/COQ6 family hydroxylase